MADDDSTRNRVAGSRLCELCGINRQTRDKWADGGLLRKRAAYEQLDLIEAVVLKLLLATLRKNEAKVAWMQLRPQLRSVVAGGDLTLVRDGQRRAADLALTAEDVLSLVRHGRPVQVLHLGPVVEDARAAFRREVALHASQHLPARVVPRSRSRPTPRRRSAPPPPA
jgi:hypothetical protein